MALLWPHSPSPGFDARGARDGGGREAMESNPVAALPATPPRGPTRAAASVSEENKRSAE